MYFLKFEGFRKFIPPNFVNQANCELIPAKFNLEGRPSQKFVPAKLCTFKVIPSHELISKIKRQILKIVELAHFLV